LGGKRKFVAVERLMVVIQTDERVAGKTSLVVGRIGRKACDSPINNFEARRDTDRAPIVFLP
jgi:hypothetical protein